MDGSSFWRKIWSASTVLLLLSAVGCGESDSSSAAPEGDDAGPVADSPSAEAPRAEPPGAESPQALVERLRRAVENEDMGEMAACMTPSSRAAMAKGMYFAATMMVAFSAMGAEMGEQLADEMGEMAGEDVQQDEAALDQAKPDAQLQVADLTARYNELVSKYGLPEMTEDEEEMAEPPDDVFETMDHSAFLNDLRAFMDEKGDGEGQPAPSVPVGELEDLEVEGDRASGKLGGEEVRFVRIDGRWYADIEEGGGSEETASTE